MPLTRPAGRSGNGSKSTGYREPQRFVYALLAPDGRNLLCKTEDGHVYELPLSALATAETWDESAPVAVRLIHNRFAARLTLRSGARIELPVDFVLYHCESAYRYHRSRVKPRHVGSRVKEVREEKGLTLEAVAKATGMAVPNLSRLEHNKVVPTLPTLQRLARALSVPLSELVSTRWAAPVDVRG